MVWIVASEGLADLDVDVHTDTGESMLVVIANVLANVL